MDILLTFLSYDICLFIFHILQVCLVEIWSIFWKIVASVSPSKHRLFSDFLSNLVMLLILPVYVSLVVSYSFFFFYSVWSICEFEMLQQTYKKAFILTHSYLQVKHSLSLFIHFLHLRHLILSYFLLLIFFTLCMWHLPSHSSHSCFLTLFLFDSR